MIAVLTGDAKLNSMLFPVIKKNTDINIEFFDNIEELEKSCPSVVIVSVIGNNTDLLISLKSSDIISNSLVFLIGDRYDQTLMLYKYQCDGFIHINKINEDIMLCMKKIKVRFNSVSQLNVKAFGRFEVFYNDKPLNFRNKKSKELFALCIDHNGTIVTIEEAADKLWPNHFYDDNVKQLYRKAAQQITNTLESIGMSHVFSRFRGSCCIYSKEICCDYFKFLNNPSRYSYLFNDTYMFEYPWAEYKLPEIERIAYGYNYFSDV